MIRTTVALLLFVCAAGCQREPAQATNSAEPALEAQAAAPPAATAAPAAQTAPLPSAAGAPEAPTAPVPTSLPDVLARVNGEPINRAEFERALRNVEGRAGQPVPAERRNEIYRGILDQLVAYKVLKQECAARKLTVTDAEVEARIADIKKQFPSEDEFGQALAARSLTLDGLKQETRDELIMSQLVEAEVKPRVSVKDTDIKDFYDKNPERFQQPESVRASHILIRVEPNATPADKTAARAKIDAVLAELKGGADFAEMAKKHSQDGSAPQGGDLNFFSRGQMVPPFEEAAFTLGVGSTSDVVETQFGYHIIKVTEKRAPRTVPLAEVAARIGQFLTMQQQQQQTEVFINGLKAKSKIEVLM